MNYYETIDQINKHFDEYPKVDLNGNEYQNLEIANKDKPQLSYEAYLAQVFTKQWKPKGFEEIEVAYNTWRGKLTDSELSNLFSNWGNNYRP